MKKKFEIKLVGPNIFFISFEDEGDLEMILEGRPQLFRKQVINFDRLLEPVNYNKISLTQSLFWLKIGPCPPECDKKDLMYAVGMTYGGVLRSEVKAE